eukprot:1482699-Pyramimonas_sp.AAC.1
MLVRFGEVDAHKNAWYFVRTQEGQDGWDIVNYDEYRARGGPLKPQFGILEMLAQRAQVRWVTAQGERQAERQILPPVAVASAS